ncbi:glycosyltransferase [Arsenicicoccus sp. oral taxon 190]|uniref:glycosyltransferase n=1 Tax=Arsenicicoccus sp. oral taxon 190 TaxID=1658671 RepID=UPI00067D1B57|nr:glycosyltransferase [Arsenicicoccus sp. oral taxon 190]
MIRVASIPGTHPYVAQVLPRVAAADYPQLPVGPTREPAGAGGAARLPDPLPAGRWPAEGVWWPPRMLEPGWIAEHASDIDVVHLHFGFEGRTTGQLQEWLAVLGDHDLPLVLTAHDLANPHLRDQTPHLAALDVLVPAASHVLTLTPAAAQQLRERWGVRAQVVPHPQVVDDGTILATQRGPSGMQPRVGMHLGAVRANVDPAPWVPDLVRATERAGAVLEVVVNDEVLRGDDRRQAVVRAVEDELAGQEHARLRHVRRMSDPELHAWVAALDVAVLPYQHGTHSGWLEMCWDLGTSVLVPAVGCYAEQHVEPGFHATLRHRGVSSALASLLEARAHGCPWGDARHRVAARAATGAHVRAAHEAAYGRVLAGGPNAVAAG